MSRTVLFAVAGVFGVLTLMLYKLQSLTPGLSPAEIATYQNASSLSIITDNMVNAPYKLSVFLSTQIIDSTFGLRLVGAMVGALTIIVFYFLIRSVVGPIVSIAVTAMFASSTLLLVMSRTATAYVMLLSLFIVFASGFYIRFGKRKDVGWIVAAVALGLSLYVPGMIIFILPAVIWQFRNIKKSFERLETPVIVASSVAFGVLCVPLIVSLIRDPNLWRGYLGFPETFASISDMIRHSAAAISSIFVMTPIDSSYWLGRQPVLDVFAVTMFIIGTFALISQYKLDRLWTILGILAIGVAWIGITTNRYGILVLLPFIYVVIGIGVQKLINQWLSVFPKNPIARYTGAALLATAIVVTINFQLHRYFVAWPNNQATKQTFSEAYPGTRQ